MAKQVTSRPTELIPEQRQARLDSFLDPRILSEQRLCVVGEAGSTGWTPDGVMERNAQSDLSQALSALRTSVASVAEK